MRILIFGAVVAFVTFSTSEARSAFGDPSAVTIDKGSKIINGNYGRFNDRGADIPFNLDASNQKFVKGLVDNRHNLLAGARSGTGTAALNGETRASIVAFNGGDDPDKLTDLQGGAASAGEFKGNGQFGGSGNDKTIDFESEGTRGKADLDAKVKNFNERAKTFDNVVATNDRINAALTPNKQDREDGFGTLGVEDKGKRGGGDLYLYTIKQDQRTKEVETVLSDRVGSLDRSVTDAEFQQMLRGNQKWKCSGTALSQGESTCVDMKTGRKVGRVVTTKDEVAVYNAQGIRVGKGKVIKKSDRHYEVVASDGLLSAKVDGLQEEDCLREIGGSPNKKITMKQPIRFIYPDSKNGDQITFQWPSCFKMQADFEVSPGVDFSRIALEFDAHIRPIGRLRCNDPGTCGKECFYCNYCKNNEKLKIMKESSSNLCDQSSARTFTAEVEVCPPSEGLEDGICTAFVKDVEYIKNKGDGVFTIIVYEMPANLEALQKEFFDKINAPFIGGAAKQGLKIEYLLENSIQNSNLQVSDETLLEWYISKKQKSGANKLEPLSCLRQTVNYEYGGSKVNANYLVDVATTNSDSFFTKRCPKKDAIDAEQFKAHQADYNANRKSGGLLSGLLGGK